MSPGLIIWKAEALGKVSVFLSCIFTICRQSETCTSSFVELLLGSDVYLSVVPGPPEVVGGKSLGTLHVMAKATG